MAKNRKTPDMNLPVWFDGQNINEALFCEEFLQESRIIFANRAFFTPNGRVTDDIVLRGEVYEKLKSYTISSVPQKIKNIMELLKLEAMVEDLPPQPDRIHVANGTLMLDGRFIEGKKEIVQSRLPVSYNPNAAAPALWGKMIIAAANPDMMENMIEEGDFVILGNRYESQLCAIEMEAGCLIICEGAKVSSTITKIAAQHNCVIISTAYDTYTVARLINQAIPVSFFMKQEALIKFKLNDFIEDIQDIMAKKRYRDFPIEDDTGRYVGMISRRNIIKTDKKKIILVDHNEKNQAVFGIEDTDILEIIDHHRLGCIQTITPVFFRNQPLGCTATIIYQMYCEHNIDIDKTTAALLCSAIISDTLILKSPTCTHYDVDACQVLADIAGIDIEEYGREMFRAGSNLSDKSEEEIFYRDYKKFSIGEITVGVGQVNCMSQEEIEGLIKKEASYITSVTDKSDEINIAYLLLTDVMKETSYVMLSGKNAEQVLMQAFNLDEITNNYVILPGVVSRKKQFLPAIVEVLQQ